MKILAIGNSFSQDATRYLHQIAKADGTDLTVVNLYIGGCPLSLHYKNMLKDNKAYDLEFNGQNTGFKVSLEDALLAHDWDFITFQQVSHDSPDYSTYQPYLANLADYARVHCPRGVQLIHQTWAYEKDSDRLTKELGYKTPEEMFGGIKASYEAAAKDIRAKGIIPSGELMLKLAENGMKVHRDTFHASLGAGRYALALLWYAVLTGKEIKSIKFKEFDEEVKDTEVKLIRKTINEILK